MFSIWYHFLNIVTNILYIKIPKIIKIIVIIFMPLLVMSGFLYNIIVDLKKNSISWIKKYLFRCLMKKLSQTHVFINF